MPFLPRMVATMDQASGGSSPNTYRLKDRIHTRHWHSEILNCFCEQNECLILWTQVRKGQELHISTQIWEAEPYWLFFKHPLNVKSMNRDPDLSSPRLEGGKNPSEFSALCLSSWKKFNFWLNRKIMKRKLKRVRCQGKKKRGGGNWVVIWNLLHTTVHCENIRNCEHKRI